MKKSELDQKIAEFERQNESLAWSLGGAAILVFLIGFASLWLFL